MFVVSTDTLFHASVMFMMSLMLDHGTLLFDGTDRLSKTLVQHLQRMSKPKPILDKRSSRSSFTSRFCRPGKDSQAQN